MLVSSLELCADLCEIEKFAGCEANHLSLPLRITGITQKQNKNNSSDYCMNAARTWEKRIS